MTIDRFIDPIYANVEEHFGCLKEYRTYQEFELILKNADYLKANNIHIFKYATDCVFLIDLEQSIQVLAAFKKAIHEEDPTFKEKEFDDNWSSPVACYYKAVKELYADAEKMLNAIGPKIFSSYGLNKLLDSFESIARQYSIESGGLFCRKNKRAYRKQAEVLISRIDKMGIKPRWKVIL